MSEVYTSGIGYDKRYWIAAKRTTHFITFQRLRWSEDLMNERGVMYPTDETVRVKDARHLWRRGYGIFSKHDDPSNPIEVRQPPTPPHDQS